jgi:NAD(P)-dependent dehydrogenase (short-subunit alcohol dehydrogenase family)
MSTLEGKTAIVTGASQGIGAAIATELAQAGARVALVARSRSKLEAVATDLPHTPAVIVQDLAESGAGASVARRAVDALGSVDIVVNNAARLVMQPISSLTEGLVDEMFAVNVRAPMMLVAELSDGMARRGGGAIVNVSSQAATIGAPFQNIYASTKAALYGMTRALAAELGGSGIRVNGVAPGSILTEMAEMSGVREIEHKMVRHTSLGRLGTPNEVAGVVRFLVSEESSYVTGETIMICGGLSNSFHVLARDA